MAKEEALAKNNEQFDEALRVALANDAKPENEAQGAEAPAEAVENIEGADAAVMMIAPELTSDALVRMGEAPTEEENLFLAQFDNPEKEETTAEVEETDEEVQEEGSNFVVVNQLAGQGELTPGFETDTFEIAFTAEEEEPPFYLLDDAQIFSPEPEPQPNGPYSYQARAVLHSQDVITRDSSGDFFVDVTAISRTRAPSSMPQVAYLGGDDESMLAFEVLPDGTIKFSLTQAGWDVVRSGGYSDPTVEMYYQITVDGYTYTLQVVVPLAGQFDSKTYHIDCRYGDHTGQLIHGEWHAGKSIDGSVTNYTVESTNMSDIHTYDGRVENSSIRTGHGDEDWGADIVNVNCHVAATGGENMEIIAKGANSIITVKGERQAGVVTAQDNSTNRLEASGVNGEIAITNQASDGPAVYAKENGTIEIEAANTGGKVTIQANGSTSASTIAVFVNGENAHVDIKGTQTIIEGSNPSHIAAGIYGRNTANGVLSTAAVEGQSVRISGNGLQAYGMYGEGNYAAEVTARGENAVIDIDAASIDYSAYGVFSNTGASQTIKADGDGSTITIDAESENASSFGIYSSFGNTTVTSGGTIGISANAEGVKTEGGETLLDAKDGITITTESLSGPATAVFANDSAATGLGINEIRSSGPIVISASAPSNSRALGVWASTGGKNIITSDGALDLRVEATGNSSSHALYAYQNNRSGTSSENHIIGNSTAGGAGDYIRFANAANTDFGTMRAEHSGKNTIQTGAGDDKVELGGISAWMSESSNEINMGSGNDTLIVHGAIDASQTGTNLIDAGSGSDTVTVYGTVASSTQGNTQILANGDGSAITIEAANAAAAVSAGINSSVVIEAEGVGGTVDISGGQTGVKADGANATVSISGTADIAATETGVLSQNGGKTTITAMDDTDPDGGTISITSGKTGVSANNDGTAAGENALEAENDISITVAGTGDILGVGSTDGLAGGTNTISSNTGDITIQAGGTSDAVKSDTAYGVSGGTNIITADAGTVDIRATQAVKAAGVRAQDGAANTIRGERVTITAESDGDTARGIEAGVNGLNTFIVGQAGGTDTGIEINVTARNGAADGIYAGRDGVNDITATYLTIDAHVAEGTDAMATGINANHWTAGATENRIVLTGEDENGNALSVTAYDNYHYASNNAFLGTSAVCNMSGTTSITNQGSGNMLLRAGYVPDGNGFIRESSPSFAWGIFNQAGAVTVEGGGNDLRMDVYGKYAAGGVVSNAGGETLLNDIGSLTINVAYDGGDGRYFTTMREGAYGLLGTAGGKVTVADVDHVAISINDDAISTGGLSPVIAGVAAIYDDAEVDVTTSTGVADSSIAMDISGNYIASGLYSLADPDSDAYTRVGSDDTALVRLDVTSKNGGLAAGLFADMLPPSIHLLPPGNVSSNLLQGKKADFRITGEGTSRAFGMVTTAGANEVRAGEAIMNITAIADAAALAVNADTPRCAEVPGKNTLTADTIDLTVTSTGGSAYGMLTSGEGWDSTFNTSHTYYGLSNSMTVAKGGSMVVNGSSFAAGISTDAGNSNTLTLGNADAASTLTMQVNATGTAGDAYGISTGGTNGHEGETTVSSTNGGLTLDVTSTGRAYGINAASYATNSINLDGELVITANGATQAEGMRAAGTNAINNITADSIAVTAQSSAGTANAVSAASGAANTLTFTAQSTFHAQAEANANAIIADGANALNSVTTGGASITADSQNASAMGINAINGGKNIIYSPGEDLKIAVSSASATVNWSNPISATGIHSRGAIADDVYNNHITAAGLDITATTTAAGVVSQGIATDMGARTWVEADYTRIQSTGLGDAYGIVSNSHYSGSGGEVVINLKGSDAEGYALKVLASANANYALYNRAANTTINSTGDGHILLQAGETTNAQSQSFGITAASSDINIQGNDAMTTEMTVNAYGNTNGTGILSSGIDTHVNISNLATLDINTSAKNSFVSDRGFPVGASDNRMRGALGIYTESNGKINVRDTKEVNIDVRSEGDELVYNVAGIAVYLQGGSEININTTSDPDNLTVEDNVIRVNASGNGNAYGIWHEGANPGRNYDQESFVNVGGDRTTRIDITANSTWQAYTETEVENSWTPRYFAAGIMTNNGISGGGGNGFTTLKGDQVNFTVTAKNAEAGAMVANNAGENTVDADSVVMTVSSEGGRAYGILSESLTNQGVRGEHQDNIVNARDITIDVGSGTSDSYGMMGTANSAGLTGTNTITATGRVQISSTAGNNAYGMYANSSGTVNTIDGASLIAMTVKGDNSAVGISSASSARNVVNGAGLEITAEGVTAARGLQAAGSGTITVGAGYAAISASAIGTSAFSYGTQNNGSGSTINVTTSGQNNEGYAIDISSVGNTSYGTYNMQGSTIFNNTGSGNIRISAGEAGVVKGQATGIYNSNSNGNTTFNGGAADMQIIANGTEAAYGILGTQRNSEVLINNVGTLQFDVTGTGTGGTPYPGFISNGSYGICQVQHGTTSIVNAREVIFNVESIKAAGAPQTQGMWLTAGINTFIGNSVVNVNTDSDRADRNTTVANTVRMNITGDVNAAGIFNSGDNDRAYISIGGSQTSLVDILVTSTWNNETNAYTTLPQVFASGIFTMWGTQNGGGYAYNTVTADTVHFDINATINAMAVGMGAANIGENRIYADQVTFDIDAATSHAYGMYLEDLNQYGGGDAKLNAIYSPDVNIEANSVDGNSYGMYAGSNGSNIIAVYDSASGSSIDPLHLDIAAGSTNGDAYAMYADSTGENHILGNSQAGAGRNQSDSITLTGDIHAAGPGQNTITTGDGDDTITITGDITGANNSILMQDGDDILTVSGLISGGNIDLGTGDDILYLGNTATNAIVNGGLGIDTLNLDGYGDTILLSDLLSNNTISGFEAIDLGGSHNNTLYFDGIDLGQMALDDWLQGGELFSTESGLVSSMEAGSVLRIEGDAGDTMDIQGGWNNAGQVTYESTVYNVYQNGSQFVMVNDAITI